MLSEQRKNQNNHLWSDFAVNPRGELWKKDKQNFGCKLMKKMGWKKGSGLGKNENGITAPIRTVQTHDNEGLGYSKQTSDYSWNWLSHQDDYTNLLNQLQKQHWITTESNSCHAQTVSTSVQQELNSENRPKSSRKRERYQRNIEGKRMKHRSEADWQCVLGKKRTKEQPTEELEVSSATETNQTLLITSTLNSHAYFMHKKQKLDTEHKDNGNLKEPAISEEIVTEEDTTVSKNSDVSHNVNKNKKKKKRKPKGREKKKKLAKQLKETTLECEGTLYSPPRPTLEKEDNEDGVVLTSGSSSSESYSTSSGLAEPLVQNGTTLKEPEPKFFKPKCTGNKVASKYKCFLECIKNDPVFQTCNLLSIKGYGNR